MLGRGRLAIRLPIKDGTHCLIANLLAALTRMGYGDHAVVQQEREALAQRIVNDGGIACGGMAYSLLPSCYMAQPKLLLCFSQVPPNRRTSAMKSAIELLAGCMLDHEVFVYVPGNQDAWSAVLERRPGRNRLAARQTVKQWMSDQRDAFLAKGGAGEPKVKPGWLRFGFPLHYNSDVLEAMYVLAELNWPMSAALERPLRVIEGKMTPDGRWILENSLNGKMWADVEAGGKPSKWLTWFALRVLTHFGRATRA